MKLLIAWAALGAMCAQGAVTVGDSEKGAALFKSQNCVTCHSVNGAGGKTGPDLGKRSSRGYTPADLTALMWNHAPKMWTAMEAAKIEAPKLTSAQAADLFAFFFAARYFEAQGDAGRGRKAFADKGCAECHNLSTANGGSAPAVVKWESVGDPIELARQMWNHSPKMREAIKAKGKGAKFPELTAAEMNDVTVYLQNLPGMRQAATQFAPGSAETGETLFKVKGCADCHNQPNLLVKAGGFMTAGEFGVSMWNHSARMQVKSELRPEEMKRLVGYLWALQFAAEGGSAARGARVFESKGCVQCHAKGSDRALAMGDRANSYEMIAVLWGHGPAMQKQMAAKGVSWPRFEKTEMTDLLAHLRGR